MFNSPSVCIDAIRKSFAKILAPFAFCVLILSGMFHVQIASAQVSTYYNFSQSNGTYTPIAADFPSTPASIFVQAWDDLAYTFPIPFDFTYNGVLYPASSGYIGLDTDGWLIFSIGAPTMTGQTGGGSWVSISDHTGVYLNGTANNKGFAGFNCDLNNVDMATFTATRTSGSNVLTAVSSVANIRVGTRLNGTGIPAGTVVISNTANTITMSANATSSGSSTTVTPSSSIYYKVIGTAPNRQLVVQWTQAKRYGGSGVDNFNFQMIINEGNGNPQTQTLQVIYGTLSATIAENLDTQVGLRGDNTADFNARQSTSNWSATTAAVANTNTVRFNNTIVPPSGLTFTWSPCTVAPGAAGAITGPINVCPGSTQSYSLATVAGATRYVWSYSGTGTTFTDTTINPTNSFNFSAIATSGTITVKPINLCGSGAVSTLNITVTSIVPATISYPSASYCSNATGTVTVTRTGPSGGTYTTSPATGLTINASTGTVTPSTSTAGVYTVIYTYSSSGCSVTATTTLTIAAPPVVTATAAPALICIGGNTQLTANVSSSGNYTVTSIPHSSLTPGGSPTVLYNSYTLDAISGAQTMPFTFSFFGQNITQFFVSTEGYIQLQTGTAVSWTPQLLPNATNPNNIIALAWADLIVDPSTNPGSSVRYFVNGIAPNRVLIIDYINLRFLAGSGQNVTGQIRLYEADNHIEVAATTVNDNGDGWTKTLGIENATGTTGVAPTGRNLQVWNTSNEAWAFYPPVGTNTFSWSPATYLSNTTIFNPTATGVAATTTYTVTVTNSGTGCSSTANTTVTASAPLSGTYTVGVSGNYPTLTAAVNAYNTLCIGGPIVFSLIDNNYSTSETFPISINVNAYASAVNTLTIRPAASVNATITGSVASNALIRVLGNYVTIDGSNNGTNTRNLTIANSNTTSPSVILFGSTGVNPIQSSGIKNTVLNNGSTGASALLVTDATTLGNAGYCNNISIINNNIQRAYIGIYVRMAVAANNGSGLLIDSNAVNSTGANNIRLIGIYVEGLDGGTISKNDVGNFEAASAEVDKGIFIAVGCRNITIEKNKVHDIRYTGSSGYAGQGIVVATGNSNANINIRNNMLYNFTGDGDSYTTYGGFYSPAAIYLFGSTVQTGINIYYNSIFMNGSTINRTNALSIGIAIDDNNVATVRNNMVHNRLGRSATTGIGTTAIALENAASQLINANNNNYYCNASGSGVNVVGRIATTNYTTLANWQTITGQEANSRNILPAFVSLTDLHMIPASNPTLSDVGTPVAGITDDIDGQTRNALTPDIGCDEWVKPNYGSWVGLVSIDWLNPVNWEANFVPVDTTDVFITGGYTFMPTIVTTQAVRDLNMSAPGSPPILTLNNGTLQVNRTITRTGGSIIGSTGTLEMKGTIAQTIPAGLFQNNNLRNLVIGNTNSVTGVTLGGALDIYNSVTFSAAGLRLTTGGHLTFKSTLAGTAWLGNVTGKTITGAATVERYIPTGINHGKSWQFIAVPLSGAQTINQAWQDTATVANQSRFSGYGTQLVTNVSPLPALYDALGGAVSIKTYNPASNAWDAVPNTTTTAIANKRGYMVFVRGDRTVTTLAGAAVPTTLRAKGNLYTTGAGAPPVTTVPANSYESVGNPYASAIDFLSISKPGPAQVDDAFYVWDPLRYGAWGYGAYQTISSVNGYKPVPGGSVYYDATVTHTRIESGQAFMLHATGAGSGGNVSFTETAKVSGSNMINRPQFRLGNRGLLYSTLFAVNTQGGYLADATLAAFDEAFSNGYDYNDATKINNPGENLGIRQKEQVLAIEARSPISINDTIFYNLANLRKQDYRFAFAPENLSGLPYTAFLVDQYLASRTAISLSDSSFIHFNVNNDEGSSAPGRFYLVFKPMATVPVAFTGISAIRNSEKDIAVNWTVDQEINISTYVLERSVDGRDFNLVTEKPAIQNQGGRASYNHLDDQASPNEYFYRVKAYSRNGHFQYSNIARVAPVKASPSISVYPNPVVDGNMQVRFQNLPKGRYMLQLSNKSGQVVDKSSVNIEHTVQVLSVKPGSHISSGTYQLQVFDNQVLVGAVQVMFE